MIRSEGQIFINNKKLHVFDYLDNPNNHVEFTPSLKEANNIVWLDNGGKKVDYNYNMIGVTFEGSLEEVERDAPNKMVFNMEGDIEGQITIELQEVNESCTKLTYVGEYDVFGNSVVENLFGSLASRYNSIEIKKLLSNVKNELENSSKYN